MSETRRILFDLSLRSLRVLWKLLARVCEYAVCALELRRLQMLGWYYSHRKRAKMKERLPIPTERFLLLRRKQQLTDPSSRI